MLLECPDAVVAHHADDVHAVPRERVVLHPREAERAVAEQQHDLALRSRELRRKRIARAAAEAAEGSRVEPAARLVGVHHAARVGDEVATVADDDRRAIDHLGEAAVDAHRMQRRTLVVQLRRLGRVPLGLDAAQLLHPRARATGVAAGGRGRRAQCVERRRQRAVELSRDRPRVLAQRLGDVDDDDLRLRPERLAEAEAEIHRHADHERHVGVRQCRPPGAREEQVMVGRHAAAREAVEEDRHAELLSQRPQRLLAVAPIEVRARHHDRPLGLAQAASPRARAHPRRRRPPRATAPAAQRRSPAPPPR